MKLLALSLCCALPLVSAQVTQYPVGGDLIGVLRAVNLSAYADHLEGSPETLALFEQQEGLTLFAPTSLDVPSRSLALNKRQNNGSTPMEKFDTDDRGQAYIGEGSLDRLLVRRQNLTTIPPSNFVLRRTLLEDSSVANLGPGEPLSFVTNYRYGGDAGAQLQLQAGFGTLVNTTAGPFKFATGVIYATDS